jgi:hypothetical protein
MSRVAPVVDLSNVQRTELERVVRATGSAQFEVVRARIILLASSGSLNEEIATALELPQQTVGKWRRRFCLLGMRGLEDAWPLRRLIEC